MDQAFEKRAHFLACEDHRKARGPLGVLKSAVLFEVAVQDLLVEEDLAQSAWFWVDAATCSSAARCVRNRIRSSRPSFSGCRVPQNRTYRLIQWT
jgi:hypothetical protein